MALYFYQAYSKDGKTVNGQVDAASLQQVKEQLSRQGLFLISISLEDQGGFLTRLRRMFAGRTSTKDIILFSKQLAVLLRSGVPLLQALELLTDHFSGALQTTIIKIKDEIKEGSSLADALKKYPKTFDTTYVQLVRAGEASGKLEQILERLTDLLERRAVVSGKIREALTMPVIQMIAAILVVIFLMVKVIPTMGSVFLTQGKELPAPTKLLMSLSTFFVNYYLFIILGIVLLIVGFSYWRSTPTGKKTIDTIILRIPYLNYFAKTAAVVQCSQTLGMLLESGVNLAESLDIVCSIINNRVLADALNEARDKIIKQGKIAQYLKQTKMFPPIAIYLIQTGEQTGKLDVMLLTVARNYEGELVTEIDKMTTFLNVLLMITMAITIGFIVLSIALPMVSIGEIVK